MESPPPPLPAKTRRSSTAPVIVSATRHSRPHVVKIRVNSGPVAAPAVHTHTGANTVRININSELEELNMRGSSPYYFYTSGQSSPSDTLDSGTCSDLEHGSAPPLPKKGGVTVTVHQRGGSLTSSGADAESDDEISCDSLNSSELDGSTGKQEEVQEDPIVLRENHHNIHTQQIEEICEVSSKLSLEEHEPLSTTISDESASLKSVVEERTYEDRNKPADAPFNPDSFYKFHLNENSFEPEVTSARKDDEDYFAGCKGFQEGDPSSATIRSSRGTIRGVKNRVRAGIATFLQIQATKTWQEREAGKIVVYTTTMGIVRSTYQRCLKVRQILRTHLVKYDEKDVFMSRETQAEIKERMNCEEILVPQVFIEGQYIGDAEVIERLNESGELRRILKPYKSPDACTTCQVCGGYRLLPCAVCNGSKKSVHRNHFTTELVALKCMNCDEVGLVKCYAC
ncbi:LOW QUALITY PROTEIN: glutaredoxin domain-containing cysteine-rich protein CG31559-like [Macrosteles quadrilineatus]|uniref:LOW QUALITY PROTEIN: glutaredoxin domain-containing cysteine-rich protein CG31559-like n=1 Tax=Macrosteles quadrilineatus TaxID=74068 RepID=UPI0023E2CAAF|nr:LOW QUALITY PROTEIN: glutaredoxin domain-containing cysteine-rich protein CG31559-like [Macrosteles quadrilineatus]